MIRSFFAREWLALSLAIAGLITAAFSLSFDRFEAAGSYSHTVTNFGEWQKKGEGLTIIKSAPQMVALENNKPGKTVSLLHVFSLPTGITHLRIAAHVAGENVKRESFFKTGAGIVFFPVDEKGEVIPSLLSYTVRLTGDYDWRPVLLDVPIDEQVRSFMIIVYIKNATGVVRISRLSFISMKEKGGGLSPSVFCAGGGMAPGGGIHGIPRFSQSERHANSRARSCFCYYFERSDTSSPDERNKVKGELSLRACEKFGGRRCGKIACQKMVAQLQGGDTWPHTRF